MPKVSVIIPTYNRAKLLPAAIQSALDQTFQDLEIIVVDDASPDNTADVVAGFKDSRIRYVRHSANKGEAGTRNTGLRHVSGDFIAFLDDDDLWLPEKLEKQMRLLESSPPRVGAVYCGFTRVERSTGNVIGETKPEKRGDIFRDMVLENCVVGGGSTVLLRKRCLGEVGEFDEEIPFGPDYDMWIRVSQKFQFDFINEPLMIYHEHTDRMSTNYPLMIAGLEAQLRKYGHLFAGNRRSYSEKYRSLGSHYLRIGNPSRGRQAFLKALCLYPLEPRNYFYFLASCLGLQNYKRLMVVKQRIVRAPWNGSTRPSSIRS